MPLIARAAAPLIHASFANQPFSSRAFLVRRTVNGSRAMAYTLCKTLFRANCSRVMTLQSFLTFQRFNDLY